ncbi:uncharacterized protein LOC132194692 [Neocloeon triangulifer]|uniref:uncharacterized protein LOC132194692 n=1 Tax=Neocloeon triangulifer TaxID=2078957 RepID=UPI00286F32A0|nr:uncharacterized protein LOC132194692 [Neocloeon triangulifer]
MAHLLLNSNSFVCKERRLMAICGAVYSDRLTQIANEDVATLREDIRVMGTMNAITNDFEKILIIAEIGSYSPNYQSARSVFSNVHRTIPDFPLCVATSLRGIQGAMIPYLICNYNELRHLMFPITTALTDLPLLIVPGLMESLITMANRVLTVSCFLSRETRGTGVAWATLSDFVTSLDNEAIEANVDAMHTLNNIVNYYEKDIAVQEMSAYAATQLAARNAFQSNHRVVPDFARLVASTLIALRQHQIEFPHTAHQFIRDQLFPSMCRDRSNLEKMQYADSLTVFFAPSVELLEDMGAVGIAVLTEETHE